MLSAFSKGDFSVREEVTREKDPLDPIVAGLNALGSDLDSYQRAFLNNILSNIDEVIYVRDIDINDPMASPYSFISGRAEEILGLSRQDLAERPQRWSESVHPQDSAMTVKLFKELLQSKQIVITYRMYHQGMQQYRWIEDRISAKANPNGQVMHIYGSARDITEQEETRLQLEKTSQLVTRLITSSDQVFYIVTLDYLDPLKNTFTYLSPHVEGVIGYSVDDVRNDPLTWLNAIHPEDVSSVKSATRDMFKSKNPGTRVYRMKHKLTGEYVWLEDYIVPILDEEGWIREFYASARDITARRTAELERENLIVQLRGRHDELMQFNHIVSHNLRSPVASILGLAQFLDEKLPPNEVAETTGFILQAALSMDELLRDLNTVLSLRSTMSEKMQVFLLSDVVASTCLNLKEEIAQSSTSITIDIDDNADQLFSIKSYVHSVFFNLLSNAIKYRSPDRDPVINIKVIRNQEDVVISIQDNGAGIDLKLHKERIFALYGRLHVDHEGKGLGLYMTKTQIETLNGTIDVSSQVGYGTTFTIILQGAQQTAPCFASKKGF